MSDNPSEGPGQAAAPALFLHFRLTPADALAWEMLPAEARGWLKAALFAPWIMLGLGWGVTEGNGLALWLRLALAAAPALAVWALSQALISRARQRRAIARIPAPLEMVCTSGARQLVAHPDDQPQTALTVTPETLRQVVLTPTHLFLDADPALLILPRAAFAEAADMAALAAHWDSLSQQARP